MKIWNPVNPEMDTTCGACLSFTSDGIDVLNPYRTEYNLPRIIVDHIGVKVGARIKQTEYNNYSES